MTPERTATVVGRWVRRYTRELPAAVADRRTEEIQADLHDQIEHERAAGTSERRIALSILSRMVRGVASDLEWRGEQTRAMTERPPTPGGPMDTRTTTYRSAVALAVGTMLFLAWGVAAMGIVGAEGDPFDLLYFGVLAVGVVGAALARFRPHGMARALLAMAVAQAIVVVIALLIGKQQSPVSSVVEIVGLNAFYIALFLGAAWLFQRAAQGQPPPSREPSR